VYQFHRDERTDLADPGVVNQHDVGALNGCDVASLALNSPLELVIIDQVWPQDLESDFSIQPEIPRLPHGGHGALADLGYESVTPGKYLGANVANHHVTVPALDKVSWAGPRDWRRWKSELEVAFLENNDGSQIMIEGERITIGRDESNDLCLRHDMRASRRHSDIVDRGGQWVIEDLGSKNGTVVNGRRIKEHPLKDRDVIEIAGTRLTYRAGLDPRSTEVASLAGSQLPQIGLTSREREILACVSSGLSDKEISAALSISINTVRSHLERMREKTGLRKRSELTRLAVEMGLEKLT